MRTGSRARAALASAVLVLFSVGCRDSGGDVEAVESLPRSLEAEAAAGESETPQRGERLRRAGDGPESILEFGLFGPVVPTLGAETFESDCNFENDPYETCL